MKIETIFDPERKVSFLVPLVMSGVIVTIDFFAPPQIILSIFFTLPIIVAGWYNGLHRALILALLLPLIRLYFSVFIEPLWDAVYSVINAFDRMIVLVIVSFLAAQLSASVKQLRIKVKVLEGLIPICANCKKIRDDNQEWQPLEKYITEHTESQFTHGICPDCMKTLYGKYIKK